MVTVRTMFLNRKGVPVDKEVNTEFATLDAAKHYIIHVCRAHKIAPATWASVYLDPASSFHRIKEDYRKIYNIIKED